MKALIKTAPGKGNIIWGDHPVPVPGAGEVQLEMILVGLCHTDLGMVNGDFDGSSGYHPSFPLVMGHEYLGRVTALGAGVNDLTVGDRVVGSAHITCRECEWCLRGRSMLCLHRRIVDLDVNGAFAERFVVPRINLVPIGDQVSDRLAVLAEPLAVALHAVDLAGVANGEQVAVVGPGTVGMLVLGALGPVDATVVGRIQDATQLERAREFGAVDSLIDTEAQQQTKRFDVVLEASGTTAGVELSVKLLRPGGRMICIGLPADEARISSAELAWNEQSMIGSRAYDHSTWQRIPEKLAAAPQLENIVSHEFAVSDYSHAIELVESRAASKVVLHL